MSNQAFNFDEFYKSQHSKLIAYCRTYKYAYSPEIAEQHAQEIWLRFLAGWAKVPQPYEPLKLLFGEAKRHMIDNERRLNRYGRGDDLCLSIHDGNKWLLIDLDWMELSEDKLDITCETCLGTVVSSLIASLTPLRQAIWRYHVNAIDDQLAAQALGLSYPAYRSRVFRIRHWLIRELSKRGFDVPKGRFVK